MSGWADLVFHCLYRLFWVELANLRPCGGLNLRNDFPRPVVCWGWDTPLHAPHKAATLRLDFLDEAFPQIFLSITYRIAPDWNMFSVCMLSMLRISILWRNNSIAKSGELYFVELLVIVRNEIAYMLTDYRSLLPWANFHDTLYSPTFINTQWNVLSLHD